MTWIAPSIYNPHLLGTIAGRARPISTGQKFYWVIKLENRAYYRSRLAHLYMTGSWPADMMDHINGDSLDDRWINLRAATRQQNSWNLKPYKRTTSLPMGVHKAGNVFKVMITKNGQQHYLGCFDTPREAEAAYLNKRKELFGEFA